MKLFGLGQTRPFAEGVAAQLGAVLAPHEERDFPDGEFKVRPLESVRGADVLVCQSLAGDATFSANDKLMRLLVFCGALADAAAARVTAVVPYLAYWRKDRRTQPRDPVTTRYVAQLFEAVGVDAVMTADAHSVATFENAFRCGKEHLEAAEAFAAHFAGRAAAASKVAVVSPDAGGVSRARAFAAELAARAGKQIETAFVEKRRAGGEVSSELFAGDVAHAFTIVYDDMISTGATLARAAAACAARGAESVHAAATHGVLTADAASRLSRAGIASLAVTNTVPDVRARCAGFEGGLDIVDAAPLFARAIERITRVRGPTPVDLADTD